MQGARYNIINLSIFIFIKAMFKTSDCQKDYRGGNFRPSHVDFLAFAR